FVLGGAGRIDISFQNPHIELGFEVKINDDSARNDDAAGVPQLVRYAEAMKARAKKSGKQWALVFVPPTAVSSVCAEEYLSAREQYPENLFLWPWKAPAAGNKYAKYGSIEEVLRGIYKQEDAGDALNHNAQDWLCGSLLRYIPELVAQDPGRFPVKADFIRMGDNGRLYRQMFKHYGRFPSSSHTVVGIPYGREKERAEFKNNCMFRIRTTKAYYRTKDEQAANMPGPDVVVELWPEVYAEISGQMIELRKEYALGLGVADYHLDELGNIPMICVTLDNKIADSFDSFIEKWDKILKDGFVSASNKVSR
ncbi:MAG: hypothetical protein ABIG11_10315, partial [bacterium]